MSQNYHAKNKEIFEKTIEECETTYKEETSILRTEGTLVYHEGLSGKLVNRFPKTKVFVEDKSTVQLVEELGEKGKKLCVLNFADGETPGGLVLNGESTQEESLCRCSNLYFSLLQPKCELEYYYYNDKIGSQGSDRVIYSKDVLFFKNDAEERYFGKPVKADVITCPAPLGIRDLDALYEVARKRISNFLETAKENGAEILILGAWGCGAFRGDPAQISRAFKDVLSMDTAFEEVHFGIIAPMEGDKKNFTAFEKTFVKA